MLQPMSAEEESPLVFFRVLGFRVAGLGLQGLGPGLFFSQVGSLFGTGLQWRPCQCDGKVAFEGSLLVGSLRVEAVIRICPRTSRKRS